MRDRRFSTTFNEHQRQLFTTCSNERNDAEMRLLALNSAVVSHLLKGSTDHFHMAWLDAQHGLIDIAYKIRITMLHYLLQQLKERLDVSLPSAPRDVERTPFTARHGRVAPGEIDNKLPRNQRHATSFGSIGVEHTPNSPGNHSKVRLVMS